MSPLAAPPQPTSPFAATPSHQTSIQGNSVNYSTTVGAVNGFTGTVTLTASGLLANSLETASLTEKGFQDVGKGPGSRAGEFIEWLTIRDQ